MGCLPRLIMNATGLVSVAFAAMVLTATEAAAGGQWCAVYTDKMGGTESCNFATLQQCQFQILGLGGWCRPNPFPNTAFGTAGTWSNTSRQPR
jgi:Protein of unknown function (DUF3551)